MTDPVAPRSPAPGAAPDAVRRKLLTLPRAFAIAVALEVVVLVGLEVNWTSLFPPPEPEPVQAKLEYFEPPPPPPPPAPPPPPPKPKQPPPPKPPEPPKPDEKPLPAEKPLEPEPPPPPPPPQEPPPPPPPDKIPPDERAKAVKKVMPVYPKDALAQGTEGEVRIRLTVSALGKVLKTEVLESKPPGIFDYSAQTAAKKFTFPPTNDGNDEYLTDQVVVYRIEDDRYGPEVGKGAEPAKGGERK
jgi:TonB family protein